MSKVRYSKAASLVLIMLVSALAGCLGDSNEKGADEEESPLPTERAPTIYIGSEMDQTITCDRDDDGVHMPDLVMLSGLIDNYDGATVDPNPNPSSALNLWQSQIPGYLGSLPGSTYDDPTLGHLVMHTFQIPNGIITDATLEMRLNHLDDGLPTAAGVPSSDTIMLRFEGTSNPAWNINIDTSSTSPTVAWPDAIYLMHLDTLPAAGQTVAQGTAGSIDLVQSMNSAGLLDIVVYDKQQVDYFELALCIEDDPTPTHTDITLGHGYECQNRLNPNPNLQSLTTYSDYVMTAGTHDLFATASPAEQPSPSNELTTQHTGVWASYTPLDYDVMIPGAHLLETFDWSNYALTQTSTNNLQSMHLVDAYLEVQMKGRSKSSSSDDVFVLTYVTNPLINPALSNGDWWSDIGTSSLNPIGIDGTHYTMYLSQMPTTGGSLDMLNNVVGNHDMIPDMDDSEALDVKIYDDQAVDFIDLHLCFEEVEEEPGEEWRETAGSYNCTTSISPSTYETSYTAGLDDTYSQSIADPLVNPSPSLMSWGSSTMWSSQQLGMNPLSHFLEFDEDGLDDQGILIHTFTNLPSAATQGGMMITDAKLIVSFKHGPSTNYEDDMITLRFEDPNHIVTPWSAMISNPSTIPNPSGYSYVLNLDELPLSGTTSLEAMSAVGAIPGPVHLLGGMNALSILDVTIQDGVIVDDMELIICAEDITLGDGGFDDNCTIGSTNQLIEVYTAGLQDNFDTQIIDPSMSYSPSQLEYMQWSQQASGHTWSSNQIGDFDIIQANKWLMHQFTGLPNDILQANLEIGMKDYGANTQTDSLILSWFETDDGTASGNWLGGNQNGVVTSDIWNNPSGQYSSQLVNYEFTALTAATTGPGYILNLDMNAMHSAGTTFNGPSSLVAGPYSLIDELNSKSYFEVLIQDDTIVDFIRLTICRDKIVDVDSDGDGISDIEEGYTLDTDNDGTPNYLDIDSDGDNIHDTTEWSNATHPSHSDVDGNGELDYLDLDSDGDHLNDTIESVMDMLSPDLDYDGNWRDTDSDGDGHLDYDEWIDHWDPYDPNSHP